ncbi:MAG: outer membrane beta-barrel protein [Bacteroidota bacterium]
MKMIKLILPLFLCLLFQEAIAQLSVGVKGGYTRAWEFYDRDDLPDNAEIHIHGYHITGMIYTSIGQHFSIGAEPGFIQRGAACIPGFIDFNSDRRMDLNYVEVPLMLSGRIKLFNNKFSIYGKIGAGAAFLTSVYEEQVAFISPIGEVIPMDPIVREKIDLDNSRLRRWDFGLYSNLGFAYHFGPNQIFLETGYYHALRDADTGFTSQNRSINTGMGYMRSF